MDRIDPIGPRERDVPRVEPIMSRITPEERERRQREQEERRRREQEQQELGLPDGSEQDDDGQPHVDIRV